MQYPKSAKIIVDYLVQQLLNKKTKRPKPRWEFGAIAVIEKLLRQGLPPEKIIFHINEEIINNPQIRAGFFPLRPTKLFERIMPKEMRLVLIDEGGEERSREGWGYFEGGEFNAPPENKCSELFYKLKQEEENRIISGKNNNILNEYFRNDGFLKDEYSFISGIFNEKNTRWKTIKK